MNNTRHKSEQAVHYLTCKKCLNQTSSDVDHRVHAWENITVISAFGKCYKASIAADSLLWREPTMCLSCCILISVLPLPAAVPRVLIEDRRRVRKRRNLTSRERRDLTWRDDTQTFMESVSALGWVGASPLTLNLCDLIKICLYIYVQ